MPWVARPFFYQFSQLFLLLFLINCRLIIASIAIRRVFILRRGRYHRNFCLTFQNWCLIRWSQTNLTIGRHSSQILICEYQNPNSNHSQWLTRSLSHQINRATRWSVTSSLHLIALIWPSYLNRMTNFWLADHRRHISNLPNFEIGLT